MKFLKKIRSIATYFSLINKGNSFFEYFVNEREEKRNDSRIISFSPTRWGGIIKTALSYLNNEKEINLTLNRTNKSKLRLTSVQSEALNLIKDILSLFPHVVEKMESETIPQITYIHKYLLVIYEYSVVVISNLEKKKLEHQQNEIVYNIAIDIVIKLKNEIFKLIKKIPFITLKSTFFNPCFKNFEYLNKSASFQSDI